jgi:8-oxo-dGTP diphosphatase
MDRGQETLRTEGLRAIPGRADGQLPIGMRGRLPRNPQRREKGGRTMASPGPLDAAWQLAFRLGFRLARVWWRLRGARREGALVAVYVDQALLLVRSSYLVEWNFPGGGVKRGETPDAAARRELAEEIGLVAPRLLPAGKEMGTWSGYEYCLHFFELRVDRMPKLHLDHREIVEARFASPEELGGIAVSWPVAIYLERAFVVPAAQASDDPTRSH